MDRRFICWFATALLLTACNRATFRWQPSLSSQVPDSTPVRFWRTSDPPTVGRSLDWQRGTPKVITLRGDTLTIPGDATLGVRLNRKEGHPVAGAILGGIVGVAVQYTRCPEPKTYCGEEDPMPLYAAGLGALLGNLIKTDHWIRVRWDAR